MLAVFEAVSEFVILAVFDSLPESVRLAVFDAVPDSVRLVVIASVPEGAEPVTEATLDDCKLALSVACVLDMVKVIDVILEDVELLIGICNGAEEELFVLSAVLVPLNGIEYGAEEDALVLLVLLCSTTVLLDGIEYGGCCVEVAMVIVTLLPLAPAPVWAAAREADERLKAAKSPLIVTMKRNRKKKTSVETKYRRS